MNSIDIVDLIKTWADDFDAPVPPVIPVEYALLAVEEIEKLRALISAWADALHHDEEPYDGKVYLEAQNNLRKVVE